MHGTEIAVDVPHDQKSGKLSTFSLRRLGVVSRAYPLSPQWSARTVSPTTMMMSSWCPSLRGVWRLAEATCSWAVMTARMRAGHAHGGQHGIGRNHVARCFAVEAKQRRIMAAEGCARDEDDSSRDAGLLEAGDGLDLPMREGKFRAGNGDGGQNAEEADPQHHFSVNRSPASALSVANALAIICASNTVP